MSIANWATTAGLGHDIGARLEAWTPAVENQLDALSNTVNAVVTRINNIENNVMSNENPQSIANRTLKVEAKLGALDVEE